MAEDDAYIRLGTIAKIHGVRGEMIIRTANPSYELKENWESIFLRIDGILVPFFISSLKPAKPGEWVLKLDWYDDRNRAESLVGYSVWVPAERLERSPEEFRMDDLVGFEFLDSVSGEKGRITAYMDIPDNPLWELETGGEKILVPAREELILELDPGTGKITFTLPEGLI